MTDLRVRIKKAYKKLLDERFNLENAEYDELLDSYVIKTECVLCIGYSCSDFSQRVCPFKRFERKDSATAGCINWMLMVTGYNELPISINKFFICWKKERDKKARKFLSKLRKQAEKYIEFID